MPSRQRGGDGTRREATSEQKNPRRFRRGSPANRPRTHVSLPADGKPDAKMRATVPMVEDRRARTRRGGRARVHHGGRRVVNRGRRCINHWRRGRGVNDRCGPDDHRRGRGLNDHGSWLGHDDRRGGKRRRSRLRINDLRLTGMGRRRSDDGSDHQSAEDRSRRRIVTAMMTGLRGAGRQQGRNRQTDHGSSVHLDVLQIDFRTRVETEAEIVYSRATQHRPEAFAGNSIRGPWRGRGRESCWTVPCPGCGAPWGELPGRG